MSRLYRFRRRRDDLVPPRQLAGGDPRAFIADGAEALVQAVTLAGLLPDARVLDIGCGFGQLARPLTRFLSASGSYNGFDVRAEPIEWCRERYVEFPRFQFEHVDLVNARYHPGGAAQASEYEFPFDDGSFDLVVGTSVFAHLVTAEAEQYLRETARVLNAGGRALIKLFLLDLSSRAAISQGRSVLPFDLSSIAGPMAVVDPELPEDAVAYDHLWLDEVADSSGMRRIDAHPGSWRGAPGLDNRDIVVLELNE